MEYIVEQPDGQRTLESFNEKLRDDLLNWESFLSLEEVCWVSDRWRLDYNHHWFLSLEDAQPRVDLWRDNYNQQRPHSAWVIGRRANLQFFIPG